MAADRPQQPADTVDERGVLITAEGRERAREQLAAAATRITPARRAELRAKYLTELDAATNAA